MENKKIIVIAVVLFLIAGTGTFVFASNQGNFEEGDINYRNNEPTYQKVESDKKGQDVPIINSNNNNKNENNSTDTNANTIDNNNVNSNNSSSTTNSNSNSKKPSSNNNNKYNENGTGNNNSSNSGNNSTNNNSNNSNTNADNSNNNTSNNTNSENTENNKEDTPLTAELNYSNKELTNKDVVVTINANKEIQKISDDNWKIVGNTATRTFTTNTSSKKEITIYDNVGKSLKLEYEIKNIDKVKPKLELLYSETNNTYKPITITIISDKPIAAINETGWKYVSDTEINKVFEENVSGEIVIEDLVGNQETINYKIENYSNAPILKETDDDSSTAIVYKEPIGKVDDWTEIEDGYQLTLPIGNRLKNSLSIEKDGIEVLISNVNEKGSATKTNNPVVVTIRANKELEELEDWILSKDKKTLKKVFVSANKGTLNIKCVDGSSYNNIQYNVSSIDTVKPQISSIEVTNRYTVNITLSEYSLINDGIGWGQMRTIIGSKTYQKEDLIKIGTEEILEEIILKDNYNNINTQYIKIYYDVEADKVLAEIIK